MAVGLQPSVTGMYREAHQGRYQVAAGSYSLSLTPLSYFVCGQTFQFIWIDIDIPVMAIDGPKTQLVPSIWPYFSSDSFTAATTLAENHFRLTIN